MPPYLSLYSSFIISPSLHLKHQNLTNMKPSFILLPTLLLLTLAATARPDQAHHHHTRPKSQGTNTPTGIPGVPPGAVFGPGGGYSIPGFGSGWPGMGGGAGYGSGYGGPSGGSSSGGIVRNPVVCKDKGPCFLKKLTCPAKCFTSFHSSGKGYGGGGGGGSCTIDCKKCLAYC